MIEMTFCLPIENGSLLTEIIEDLQSESESESEIFLNEPIEKEKEPIAETDSPVKSMEASLASLGPPKILKFQPETKQPQIQMPVSSPALSMSSEPIDNLNQFMRDFNIYIQGGNMCEFCGNVTKPWPTINLQEGKILEYVSDYDYEMRMHSGFGLIN